LQRFENVLRFDVKPVDVVQPAIISLGDHRQRKWLKEKAFLGLPLNDRIPNDSNAVGVRDPNRAFQETRLFHPGRTGHFTVPV
jgi:hypothetical protein